MLRKSVLLLGLCLILTGCLVPAAVPVEEETEESTVLEFYTWQDEKEYMIRVINSFMEEYPDITVNMHFIPSSEYGQTISVLHNTQDRAIDVYAESKPSAAAADVERKFALDITQMYRPDGKLSGIPHKYLELLDALKIDGSLYMLPYRNSTWVVYYNKAIFDRFGIPYPKGAWTWEEYTMLARQLSRTVDGQRFYGSLNFETNSLWWRTPARTEGVENRMTAAGLKSMKNAALWNYRMTYEYRTQQEWAGLTDVGSYDYVNRFLAGNTGMFFCGDWCMEIIRRQIMQQQLEFRYDVAPLPMPSGGEGVTPVTSAVLLLSSRTRYPREALLLATYIAQDKGARILAESGILPAWDTDETRSVLKRNPDAPEHIEYFWDYENVIYTSTNREMEEILGIINTGVGEYFLQETSLEDAFDRIENTLRERGFMNED